MTVFLLAMLKPEAFSWLFLEYEGDWQGSASGYCYNCYERENRGTTREQFTQIIAPGHTKRKRTLQRQAEESRGLSWKQATQKIGDRLPGQDKASYRQSIKQARAEAER